VTLLAHSGMLLLVHLRVSCPCAIFCCCCSHTVSQSVFWSTRHASLPSFLVHTPR